MIWQVELIKYFRDSKNNQLVLAILDKINAKRDGQSIDLADCQLAISSFVKVYEFIPGNENALYIAEFEKAYLLETEKYYEKESLGKITELSVVNYVSYARNRIMDEMEHSLQVLMKFSIEKVELVLKTAFISSKLDLIHKEFKFKIWDKAYEELAAIYRLISNVDGALEMPIKYFEEYVLNDLESLSSTYLKTIARVC